MKRRKPMKRIIAAIFAVLMLVSFAACRNSDVPSDDTGNDNTAEEKIEYDYSKIEIHPMVSAGCDLPYDAATLMEWGHGLIEFVVTSEPEEVTYEYCEDYLLDVYLPENYTEEEYEEAKKKATETRSVNKISIKITDVVSEGIYGDLSGYEELWLRGDAGVYPESFVPGARFLAYVEVQNDIQSPIELHVTDYIFYIDSKEKVVPFTDDPSLMQYNGESVSEMSEISLAAEASYKSQLEEAK